MADTNSRNPIGRCSATMWNGARKRNHEKAALVDPAEAPVSAASKPAHGNARARRAAVRTNRRVECGRCGFMAWNKAEDGLRPPLSVFNPHW
jgi:ribosomal protein S27AE